MDKERPNPNRWIALIVTHPDGSESCPMIMGGEDIFSGPIDISQIRVEGNLYLQEVVKKQEPNVSYRFEELTWREITERGYREPPLL